jgi:glycine oxidase
LPVFRYDDDVDDGRNVIVIGAGIIGCAVAHELSRRGARVRVIEARAVGAGATQASAGVLAPYIEAHERGALLDLTVRSLALYDRFVADVRQDSGLDVEFRRCGTLEIAVDPAAASSLQRAPDAYARADVNASWLSTQDLRLLEPLLADAVLGALLVPSHGYVRAAQLTEALSWAAMRHGAELETSRRVIDVTSDAGNTVRVTAEDGTKWTADAVVVAAGSWTGVAGFREGAAFDVRPIRGQLLRLAWTSAPLSHVVWGPGCYVVPWIDGTVLVGATSEDVGFDERATAAGVRDLLDAVCELIPKAWDATFLEARAGLRPATSDGLPIIGPSAIVPGLFYATGHYRNGILLAPLTAVLVADLVMDGVKDAVLDRLAPSRFS